MRKLGVVTALLGALIAVVVWPRRELNRLSGDNAALREQLKAMTDARERDREVATNTRQQAENAHRELVRLRGQAVKARQIEQENVGLKTERDRLAKQMAQASGAVPADAENENSPEQMILGRKQHFARDLGTALISMAERNDNRFPTELSDQFLTLLDAISPSSTDSISGKAFELVYKGSFHDLKEGEHVRTILAREKQPMQLAVGEGLSICRWPFRSPDRADERRVCRAGATFFIDQPQALIVSTLSLVAIEVTRF